MFQMKSIIMKFRILVWEKQLIEKYTKLLLVYS